MAAKTQKAQSDLNAEDAEAETFFSALSVASAFHGFEFVRHVLSENLPANRIFLPLNPSRFEAGKFCGRKISAPDLADFAAERGCLGEITQSWARGTLG